MSRCYEYEHVVSFQETNLVGNVYFANHVSWQGRVREMFLKEHAPELLQELASGLSLATIRVGCEYYEEILAFDTIRIRMRLQNLTQNRLTLLFDYFRVTQGREQLVARGEQQVACLRREGNKLTPTPFPESLRLALEPYLVTEA